MRSLPFSLLTTGFSPTRVPWLVSGLLLWAGALSEGYAVARESRTGAANWAESGNWLPSGLPGKEDSVVLDQNTPLVIPGGHVEIGRLVMGTSAGSRPALLIGKTTALRTLDRLDFDGNSASESAVFIGMHAQAEALVTVAGFWESAAGISVGLHGQGRLEVAPGARVENFLLMVGCAEGARGEANIRGTLENRNAFSVGERGWAHVTIPAGGEMEYHSRWGVIASHPSSQGTLEVAGKLTGGAASDLVVGNSGEGTLLIQSGGVVTGRRGSIAQLAPARGRAEVRGLWRLAEGLFVGTDGFGVLEIGRGGRVVDRTGYVGFNAGANGRAVIAGEWECRDALQVGYGASGELMVSSGGLVRTRDGIVASEPQVIARATVSGRWENRGSLFIGQGGDGAFTVEQGGSVDAGGAGSFVGTLAGSQGRLDVAGEFRSERDLTIGYAGVGIMKVAAGGRVKSERGYVGRQRHSTGLAEIAGEWTCTGELGIGYEGAGELVVNRGGMVRVARAGLAKTAGSSAQITVRGNLEVAGDCVIGEAGTATAIVYEGGELTASVIRVQTGSALVVNGGALAGRLEVDAGTLTLRGRIALSVEAMSAERPPAWRLNEASMVLIENGARVTVQIVDFDALAPGTYELISLGKNFREEPGLRDGFQLEANARAQGATLEWTGETLRLRVR
ncbi:hypothetical protein [Oleiharenicola lentus]|uniref:hypothetical protein n=1 Tax=Oleiharenicola lentus TaxID=2508720 RepID=UPI003F677CAD